MAKDRGYLQTDKWTWACFFIVVFGGCFENVVCARRIFIALVFLLGLGGFCCPDKMFPHIVFLCSLVTVMFWVGFRFRIQVARLCSSKRETQTSDLFETMSSQFLKIGSVAWVERRERKESRHGNAFQKRKEKGTPFGVDPMLGPTCWPLGPRVGPCIDGPF